MPETYLYAKMRLLKRSAWTCRGLGRVKRRRHEPHVLLCEVIQQRPLEVGRVEREGHDWYVSRCAIV